MAASICIAGNAAVFGASSSELLGRVQGLGFKGAQSPDATKLTRCELLETCPVEVGEKPPNSIALVWAW